MRVTVLCIMRAASQQHLQNIVDVTRQNRVLQQGIAGVMELVDVPDSKSGARNGVGVRFPPPAPNFFCIVSTELKVAALLVSRHAIVSFFNHLKLEFNMSKLLSVLIAATFAAVSFTAVAADAAPAAAAPAATQAAPAAAKADAAPAKAAKHAKKHKKHAKKAAK